MRLSIRILSLLLHLKVTFRYIILDEGIGCYLPYEMFFMYGDNNQLWKKINNSIYNLIVEPIIKQKICIDVSDFRLFESDKNNKLKCNAAIADTLRCIYLNRRNNENKFEEKCIFVFKDFGVVASEEDISIYTKVFNFFVDLQYTVYVKKHPNDSDRRFDHLLDNYNNVKLITSIESGEELVAVYSPKFLLGGYTTVLFSAANIFNLHTISFMRMYLEFEKLNPIIRNNIMFFHDKFDTNKYLFFPAGYDELSQLLIKEVRLEE
jgi:hypothetical protein